MNKRIVNGVLNLNPYVVRVEWANGLITDAEKMTRKDCLKYIASIRHEFGDEVKLAEILYTPIDSKNK